MTHDLSALHMLLLAQLADHGWIAPEEAGVLLSVDATSRRSSAASSRRQG